MSGMEDCCRLDILLACLTMMGLTLRSRSEEPRLSNLLTFGRGKISELLHRSLPLPPTSNHTPPMALKADGVASSALRAVTYRLSTTPTKKLPQILPFITHSLASCRNILSAAHTGKGKDGNDSTTLSHKFRTQISSLLQDRTIEGRWAAVVLVKTVIEHGGQETLQACGPWVRGLLNIISKPDPPTTRKLCVITLTRIFTLTRENPGLVREITTPALPTYVEKCLDIFGARQKGPISLSTTMQRALLETVLESFNELLPRHPTIFRSYNIQIRNFLSHIIAETPSSNDHPGHSITDGAAESGRRLWVQLAFTAPKGEGPEEWHKYCADVISDCHRTADRVFRSVLEEWESVTPSKLESEDVFQHHEVHDNAPKLGLPEWTGIFAGAERLVGLIDLVKQYLSTPTPTQVKIPLGTVIDLLLRLFSIRVPRTGSTGELRPNSQASKDEREHLWAVLPGIHASALDLVLVLLKRMETLALPYTFTLLSHILWMFDSENVIPSVRLQAYPALNQIINIQGPSLDKDTVNGAEFFSAMKSCCNDILLVDSRATPAISGLVGGLNGTASTSGAPGTDTAANPLRAPPTDAQSLQTAAYDLLPTLISRLPLGHLSSATRSLLDRTAILSAHKEALLASVLNPDLISGKPSVLPFLGRLHPDSLEVEGLIRPRLPLIKLSGKRKEYDESEEAMEDAEVDAESEEEELTLTAIPESQPDSVRTSDTGVVVAVPESSAAELPSSIPLHSRETTTSRRDEDMSDTVQVRVRDSSNENEEPLVVKSIHKRTSPPPQSPAAKKPRIQDTAGLDTSSNNSRPTTHHSAIVSEEIQNTESEDGDESAGDTIAVVPPKTLPDPTYKSDEDDEGSDIEVPMISLEDSDMED